MIRLMTLLMVLLVQQGQTVVTGQQLGTVVDDSITLELVQQEVEGPKHRFGSVTRA